MDVLPVPPPSSPFPPDVLSPRPPPALIINVLGRFKRLFQATSGDHDAPSLLPTLSPGILPWLTWMISLTVPMLDQRNERRHLVSSKSASRVVMVCDHVPFVLYGSKSPYSPSFLGQLVQEHVGQRGGHGWGVIDLIDLDVDVPHGVDKHVCSRKRGRYSRYQLFLLFLVYLLR